MAYHLDWRPDLKNHSSYEDKRKMPKQWTEIDGKEFIELLYNKPPKFIYRATIFEDSDGNNLELKDQFRAMLFFHDWENQQGVAIAYQSYYPKNKLKKIHRFAKFAICFHNWRELGRKEAKERHNLNHMGMFDNIFECSECSKVKRYDSSD